METTPYWAETTSRRTGRSLEEEATVLPVAAKVYVYGWRQTKAGTADIIIAAGGSGFDYVIAREDEENTGRWARKSGWGFGMGALVAAVVAGIANTKRVEYLR